MRVIFYFFFIIFFSQCNSNTESRQNAGLSDADLQAIKKVRLEYGKAWEANDSLRIMNVLSKDAVLIPHHGDAPLVGLQAIEAFWWPKGFPPSKVTELSSTIDEVAGDRDWAFVRGRFKLVFDYDGKNYSNEGNYLNLLKREAGQWKLARLIWNDPLPTVD